MMPRPRPGPKLIQTRENPGLVKIFGITGWSGSGKTLLMRRLIPEITRRGISLSSVKHAHHAFDLDLPGKDSHTHRAAGAREVLVSSANRWALVHENRGEAELDLPAILARLSPVDLVLIEGFKRAAHDKLEIYRAVNGKPPLHPGDRHIRAVVSDVDLPDAAVPVFAPEAISAIADFILQRVGLHF